SCPISGNAHSQNRSSEGSGRGDAVLVCVISRELKRSSLARRMQKMINCSMQDLKFAIKAVLLLQIATLIFALPSPSAAPLLNTLSDAEKQEGWKLLFDGKTFGGWRAYASASIQTNVWTIADDCIQCAKRNGRPGDDILTIGQFTDFDFVFDWRITEGGNS